MGQRDLQGLRGAGRIVLSTPGSNSVDVKLLHKGPNGNLIKYTVATRTQLAKELRVTLARQGARLAAGRF